MKKLNYEKFMEREVVHAPYERELSFYEWVKQGDVEKIRKWADETEGMGSEGGMVYCPKILYGIFPIILSYRSL